MRKRYDKEFKAKVALEAIKGEKTIQDLAVAVGIKLPVLVGENFPVSCP